KRSRLLQIGEQVSDVCHIEALALVHQLRLVQFAEARSEQQPLAGKKRFIFDQMGLETQGILDEPETTAVVSAVLDVDGVFAWAEIGRLAERKASVAEHHVSRCRRPVRYQEAARFKLD